MTTHGQITVGKKAFVQGRLECGGLLVEGRLQATARVHGDTIVDPKASVRGRLSTATLSVGAGARVDVDLELGQCDEETLDTGRIGSEPGRTIRTRRPQ